jgi:hypothetical protein
MKRAVLWDSSAVLALIDADDAVTAARLQARLRPRGSRASSPAHPGQSARPALAAPGTFSSAQWL